jgi:hypothetical protein
MRLADVCNPHVKDEHPNEPRGFRRRTEGAPSLTGGRCLHAATAHFGQISAAPTGVLIPSGLATEPGPLVPPSPPRIEEFDPVQSVSAKTASTATQRDELRLIRSETPSFDRGTLLGPFSSLRQRFPPTTGSRALFHLLAVLSHLGLDAVHDPSRNRESLFAPSVAYRLLQPNAEPGHTANESSSRDQTFSRLSAANYGASRVGCERYDTVAPARR